MKKSKTPATRSPAVPGLVWLMAGACGVSVANIYYSQPLLEAMGDRGYVPACTQIGAGLGMFLFVPLGDIFERRRLIVSVCCATCVACVLTALAPGLGLLAIASLILGLTSITPHLILPFAAQISAPEERGKVLGTVLSGLLIGILLARTVSGFIGAAWGWRSMYWIAAGLMLTLAITLRGALPASPPSNRMSYRQLLRSIVSLVREQRQLREASLIGAMLFGAFSVFWATLIFVLVTPPYHYGSRMAGLFGLIGVAGALAASVGGRIADRHGPRFTVGAGILVTLASYVVFYLTGRHLAGLIAGVTLLDLGVQAGHVSNQTRIYGLIPEARSRLNTVYMVTYFAGGALGSALGAAGWAWKQWGGVCAAGMLLSCIALAVHLHGSKLEANG